MATTSDDELEYLRTGFDPNTLTMPLLRQALMMHDISYSSSAKKGELVDIFNAKLRSKARSILSARAKIRRTSAGIESVSSSQTESVDEEDNDQILDLPEPVLETRSRRTTRSTRASTAESAADMTPRQSVKRRTTRTPAQSASVSVEPESKRSGSYMSAGRMAPERNDKDFETPRQTVAIESPFSDDNPFQSGSSPMAEDEVRRKSTGRKSEGAKSTSRRRKTDEPMIKQETEDGLVTNSKTFSIPARSLHRPAVKQEEDDMIAAGEEFTPEEQEALVQESDGQRDRTVASVRRRKAKKQNGALRTAPYAILATLAAAYVVWWRKEKIEVGYCGIGKAPTTLQQMQVPEFFDFLQPKCEPCPQHAYCYTDMEAKCEKNFIVRHHPLSLNGLLPLVPTCEPDGEKARKVKAVADRAVEELRERRANFECGELAEDNGKKATTVEIPEPSLKAIVSARRRKTMSDEEFEDLWQDAVGEIKGREEVTADAEG